VYHLTDLPSFVSGRALVMFDPQAKYLPDVDPSNPGKLMDFVAFPALLTKYPNLFEPFRAFGCDFSGSFPVR
jgi:sacsin